MSFEREATMRGMGNEHVSKRTATPLSLESHLAEPESVISDQQSGDAQIHGRGSGAKAPKTNGSARHQRLVGQKVSR